MTESTLRHLIRETILAEAAVTPQAAHEMGITFDILTQPEFVTIRAYKDGEEDPTAKLYANPTDNPCSDAWMISYASATVDGLGPLMYDLMIDLVSPHPLMADRTVVSADAKRVWDYYLEKRKDIEAIQLDDTDNFLTDEEEDNCEQVSSMNWGGEEDWPDSSLSKAYRRMQDGTPVLNSLKRLGVVRMKVLK